MSESTSAIQSSSGSTRHPAVQHCVEAASAARSEAQRHGENDSRIEDCAKEAYLKAMPDLSGYENICAFIACVTYGMIHDIIWRENGTRFLYAAQVALGAIRRAPQSPKAA